MTKEGGKTISYCIFPGSNVRKWTWGAHSMCWHLAWFSTTLWSASIVPVSRPLICPLQNWNTAGLIYFMVCGPAILRLSLSRSHLIFVRLFKLQPFTGAISIHEEVEVFSKKNKTKKAPTKRIYDWLKSQFLLSPTSLFRTCTTRKAEFERNENMSSAKRAQL